MGAATAMNAISDVKRNLDNIWTDLNRIIIDTTSNTNEVNLAKGSLSGTLTLDDGSNWRLTLKFYHGRLVSVNIAASSSAIASWT